MSRHVLVSNTQKLIQGKGDKMKIFKTVRLMVLAGLLLLVQGCVSIASQEPAQPAKVVRVDTSTDFRPEVVDQVLRIAGIGFTEGRYTHANIQANDEGALLQFIGPNLPIIRSSTRTDDPGTIQVQIDNYVFEEYNGNLLSGKHGPTGNRIRVADDIYYALRREIDRALRRLVREQEVVGEIKM